MSCILKYNNSFSTILLLILSLCSLKITNQRTNFPQALIISSKTHKIRQNMKKKRFANQLLFHTRWIYRSNRNLKLKLLKLLDLNLLIVMNNKNQKFIKNHSLKCKNSKNCFLLLCAQNYAHHIKKYFK